jgi:hypothetical protein
MKPKDSLPASQEPPPTQNLSQIYSFHAPT